MVDDLILLSPGKTRVECSESTKNEAFHAAYRVVLSPHEHDWTKAEQQSMAHYVLWASQRLAAIEQMVNGNLDHLPEENH